MQFGHRSQEYVRSLPFLEGTLDMEALTFLREQMSGQLMQFIINGAQEKELLMRMGNEGGGESILPVIRKEG